MDTMTTQSFLTSIVEAEELFTRVHIPDFRPAAAMKVRVQLAQGQLTEALCWVSERNLSVEDELSYLREFEHITLARVFIAQYRNDRDEETMRQALRLL